VVAVGAGGGDGGLANSCGTAFMRIGRAQNVKADTVELPAIHWLLYPDHVNQVAVLVAKFVNASTWHHQIQIPTRLDSTDRAFTQSIQQSLPLRLC